mgnify:FL=1
MVTHEIITLNSSIVFLLPKTKIYRNHRIARLLRLYSQNVYDIRTNQRRIHSILDNKHMMFYSDASFGTRKGETGKLV